MEKNTPKVVFAQAFGIGENLTPGKTNEAIAKELYEYYRNNPDAFYFVQHEIVMAMENLGLENLAKQKIFVTGNIAKRVNTRYQLLNQMQFRLQFVEGLSPTEVKNIELFGHDDHIPRMRMMIEKVFENAEISNHGVDVYDPKSTQIWTRNAKFFLGKEGLIVVPHHIIKKWVDRCDAEGWYRNFWIPRMKSILAYF